MEKSYFAFLDDIASITEAAQGADPEDFKEKDDKDDTELKARSKGEEKFKKDNTPKGIAKHPVAKEDQFSANTKHNEHDGHEKGKGETAIVKQGNSKVTEEFIGEAVSIDDLRKIASGSRSTRVSFDNGEREEINPDMAKVMVETYNRLNTANKKKFDANVSKSVASFMKLADFGSKK